MMDLPIFFFLVLITLGCSLLFWLLYKEFFQKSTVHEIITSSDSSDNDKSLIKKVDKVLLGSLSTNTDDVERKFYAAGFYQFKFARFYMPTKYAAAVLGCIGIYWYLSSIEKSIAFMGLWFVVCISVPDAILNFRIKSLQDKLSDQLPYLLDLLAMCVHTGMTIESSMEYLSKEMGGFDKDLSHMVTRVNNRARIVGLSGSLDELYTRFPTNEMRSFVMTLKQSLHYGSSIYGILNTLAADIRNIRLLSLEEKVGKLSAKMSVPLIVFIMIPVVILIAAPGIMRLMPNV